MNRTPLALAFLLWLCLPALADEKPPQVKVEEIEVNGSVTDAEGKAVADIAVAESWDYDGNWKPNGGTKSDAEGNFKLKLRTFPDQPARGYRLQAGDEKRGALFAGKRDVFKEGVKLTLKPLAVVSATVEGVQGMEPKDGGFVNFYTGANNIWMCSTQLKADAFSVNLPRGEYSLLMSAGEDFKYVRKSFVTDEGETKLEIKLELTPIAKLYGKEPPALKISAIRNLPKDLEEKGDKVTLADFKGRWVLIEFWGFW